MSSPSSPSVFITLGTRQLLGSCHFARTKSESVFVFDCFRLRLSPSSPVSVFVCLRLRPSPSSSVPVFASLRLRLSSSSPLSVFVCHHLRPSPSSSVSVFAPLRPRLSPPSPVSVFVCLRRSAMWLVQRASTVGPMFYIEGLEATVACVFRVVRYSVKRGELVVKRSLMCCDVFP